MAREDEFDARSSGDQADPAGTGGGDGDGFGDKVREFFGTGSLTGGSVTDGTGGTGGLGTGAGDMSGGARTSGDVTSGGEDGVDATGRGGIRGGEGAG